jgi:hypothetical protein
VDSRMSQSEDEVPVELRGAVAILRQSDEPGAAWRERVVHAAVSNGAAAPRTLRLRGHAWWAAAAGLAGVLIGGSSMYIAMSPRERSVVATAPVELQSRSVFVRFTFHAPGAAAVTIVGDFNHWDPAAIPLRRSADGTTWEVEVPLAPGRYAYAFYVDGRLAPDPAAPKVGDNDFGSANSVVMVRGT